MIDVIIKNNLRKIKFSIRKMFLMKSKKKKIKVNDLTILSTDCLGGIIYHDFGMKFNSPTINMWFSPKDFIKFCCNLKYYLTLEPIELKTDYKYPVAVLDDIKLYFTHYKSFKEAVDKWNTRKKRINFNKIVLIMTDANDFSEDLMIEAEKIPYKKIMFTHKKIDSQLDFLYYLKSDKNGFFHSYRSIVSIRRFYDDFDFVSFFNAV